MDQKLCVLDTCAFINLTETSIGRENLLDLLIGTFEVYLSIDVVEEIRRRVKKGLTTEIVNKTLALEAFQKRTIKILTVPKSCRDIISKEIPRVFKRLKFKGERLDPGEKEAIGLALLLNRKKLQPVLFISNDIKANEVIREIVQNQLIGVQLNTFEVPVCLLNYQILKQKQVKTALLYLRGKFKEKQKIDLIITNLYNDCYFLCDDKKCL